MKVSMGEVNKKANLIINRVAESGESAIIFKHGKPIAEIRPIPNFDDRDTALKYLTHLQPIKVNKAVDAVIEEGRRRGV
jgi:antitoxin (DNA-binding transcriptional repressor) of toxin-antitoxin stability system